MMMKARITVPSLSPLLVGLRSAALPCVALCCAVLYRPSGQRGRRLFPCDGDRYLFPRADLSSIAPSIDSNKAQVQLMGKKSKDSDVSIVLWLISGFFFALVGNYW